MLSEDDILDLQLLVGEGGRRELVELLIQHEFETKNEEVSFYWRNIIGVVLALCLVAIGSGFFLGLMTLDAFDLKIILRSSYDQDEKMYAAALYPLVKDKHRLLVTLLIVDALAYEALPLFLDKLLPGWAVILLSTTLVMLFGEIIPSAICMGPRQLQLGYFMVPSVKVIMFILYPITRPCVLILDYLVYGPDGEDETEEEYNRGELSALVKIQYEERQTSTLSKKFRPDKRFPMRSTTRWGSLKHELFDAVNERYANRLQSVDEDRDFLPLKGEMTAPMERQEVDVVIGALQMKTKVATDVYTPRRHVYSIPDDLVLDKSGLTEIYAEGYSRVPVFKNIETRENDTNRSCLIGFLMTRQLMMIDWDHEREVSTLPLVRPDCVSPRQNLVDLLRILRSGGSLMAFVCARPDLANRALIAEKPLPVDAGFMGIITLEDILESILQTRIYDESDVRDRDRAVATLTKWATEKLQSFARKSVQKRRSSASLSPTKPRRTVLAKDILLSEKAPLLGKKAGSVFMLNMRHSGKQKGKKNRDDDNYIV